MNLGWMIFLAGIGTYLMRSAGVWLPPRLVPSRWLAYLPLAVILVMAIASLSSFTTPSQQTFAMVIAAIAVGLAAIKKLPLFACIVMGCIVYGAIAP